MRRIRKKKRVRRLFPVIGVSIALGVAGFGVGHSAAKLQAKAQQVSELVPTVAQDKGAGERVLLVVGGTYPTKAAAQQAADEYVFGDLYGYFVVPVGAFQGFKDGAGEPGDWAIASAFRTREGAEEFVALAEATGNPARIVGPVVSRGAVYAGLGMEADPNGSGPLDHPLSAAQQAALK